LALPTDATGSGLLPTPVAKDDGKTFEAHMAMKERMGRNTCSSLAVMARSGMWPTPASRDHRYPNARSYQERGGGTKGEQLPNAVGGALNPTWVEWLMGLPLGWTDCGASAIRSSRKSLS
jgi:hypothetical protein